MPNFKTLLLLLGTVATPAAAVAVDGDPVLYWNQVFLGVTPYNPGQQRPAAILNIALHDAVNATVGRPDYYYLKHVVTPGGDTRAAASVAARNVLAELLPGRVAEFDASLAASLALIPDSAAKTAGIATGVKVAQLALANRANDGTFTPVSYTPSGLPGRWAPTPPGFGPPVQPELATVTPWVMNTPSQFRPDPPPSLDSDAYTAAFLEVQAIGSATSLTRTADQTASAQFWAGSSGPGPWLKAAIDAAEVNGNSSIENARMFGKLATSVADAVIVAWDTKYTYDYWRPITAIRAADTDGNPRTAQDAGWTSLIAAPPHPSYFSAHSTISGAAATVLADAFGDETNFCVTSGTYSRCWSSFSSAALDSANSRLWGGIHWRFDNEDGLLAGQQLGAFNLSTRSFATVPEPATWTLMLVGFGAAGLGLRRRRVKEVSA